MHIMGKLSKHTIGIMLREYENGVRVCELSKKYNIKEPSVNYHIKKYGVRPPQTSFSLTEEQKRNIGITQKNSYQPRITCPYCGSKNLRSAGGRLVCKNCNAKPSLYIRKKHAHTQPAMTAHFHNPCTINSLKAMGFWKRLRVLFAA